MSCDSFCKRQMLLFLLLTPALGTRSLWIPSVYRSTTSGTSPHLGSQVLAPFRRESLSCSAPEPVPETVRTKSQYGAVGIQTV
ncbi:hypothetical protein B0T26DRAFT_697896 [Lasiosphaeria miniovina]|uniref:Uncharacterized protein n=1 Tax=Lasiosphaeria miniovina TaxID=1954250 RepID=A0AA40E7Y4_9PEZI|nr:uncharacterized protein B0T26DRAFT_697896 [Lasiosphaeria miniovina]KAK0728422.1 hypothetical protein B0T26DRAFT_697896 [Lasiosphaeria miniovina]